MSWLRRIARRCRLLLNRDAVERSMDEELRHHIESEIADRVRGGMGAAEARRTALRDFGSLQAIKEEARDARGFRSLHDAWLDVRYAARVLARNRGFTTAAVVTFALGVGAVTAIYSLVYGILLRPLPYADPDRLVTVWERNIARDADRNVVSLDNYQAWGDRARSFSGMAAIVPTSVTLAADPVPERLVGAEVTPGYFGVLGVLPAIGRDFLPSDAHHGAAVILSHALWTRRFNADRAIVGRSLMMSDKLCTIVGVMPAHFDPPRFGWLGAQDLWFPLVASEQSRAWGRFLLVVGRLRDGVSLQQARAEMTALAQQRAKESRDNDGWSASIVPLAEQITGEVHTSLLVLLAAVALLLLMAIANVATLTLSLNGRRAHEFSIRRAIGATDARLFRQLFTQSALLGALGAALGALLAAPGVRILVALLPGDFPRAGSIALDTPVLLVSMTAALCATLSFGTIAAFRGRRTGAFSPLTHAAGAVRAATGAGGRVLVIAEIAIAVALSVMAVLMVRSFVGLRAVDPGFTARNVVIARIALPPSSYPSPERRRQFVTQLLDRVGGLPQVRSAGVISARPFGGVGPATTVHDAARGTGKDAQDPVVDIRYANPGLFQALGISLERGALLDAHDAAPRPPGVVISATLARTLWPHQDAIGRELALQLYGGIVTRVAGIVADIHLMDARTPPRPTAFLSISRFPSDVQDLVVRVDDRPEAIVADLRAAVGAIDASLPLYNVTTLPQLLDRSLASDRLITLLLASFGVVALLLAGAGVFGVFAGDVARRRKEIGIRLALGARESRVMSMLLAAAMRRTIVGVAAGALLAAVLGHAMRSLLFGVRATDPFSFLIVAGIATSVALGATYLPGWQALRAQPVRSLREG